MALGQVVDNYESYSAICLLFKHLYSEIPDITVSIQEISSVIVPIQSIELNNYTYRVIAHLSPPILPLNQEELENVMLSTFSGCILIELSEAFQGMRPWTSQYDEVIELEQYILQ